jgi:hypothetical protein
VEKGGFSWAAGGKRAEHKDWAEKEKERGGKMKKV